MAPTTGTFVSADVRLEREIGQGGMGSVWLARHRNGAEVAVKLMADELVGNRDLHERMAREARIGQMIASPHVVRTLDFGTTANGTPYLVMELCNGESLRAKLLRTVKLPLLEVARIVTQIASALEHAHALGVVHRDIKPDNVFLVAPRGDVKVLDFGIARSDAAGEIPLTSAGAIMGTPAYMSPEQLLYPTRADSRFDTWATAVLAYEALVGVPPFRADTQTDLYRAICTGQYLPPSSHGLPAPFDAVFRFAFAANPDERPENPRAFATALADAVERARRSGAYSRDIAEAPTLAAGYSVLPVLSQAGPARTAPGPGPTHSVPIAPPQERAATTPVVASQPKPNANASDGARRAAPPGRRSLVWIGGALALVAVGTTALVVARPWVAATRAGATASHASASARGQTAQASAPLTTGVASERVAPPDETAATRSAEPPNIPLYTPPPAALDASDVCADSAHCMVWGACTTNNGCIASAPRQCAEPCKTYGGCQLDSGRCVALTLADCANTDLCADSPCKVVATIDGSVCLPLRPIACERTRICAFSGMCVTQWDPALGAYTCLQTDEQGCRASISCREYGNCHTTPEGRCSADAASCQSSGACRRRGRCSAVTIGGQTSCAAGRAEDCRNADVCRGPERACNLGDRICVP